MRLEQLWLKRVNETLDTVVKARRTARHAAHLLKGVAHAHRPTAKLLERKLRQLNVMLEGQRLKIPEYSGFRGFLEGFAEAMAQEQAGLAELEPQVRRLRKAIEGRSAKAMTMPREERVKRRRIQRRKETKKADRDRELYERQTALMRELNAIAAENSKSRGPELWRLTESIIDQPYKLIPAGVVESRIRELQLQTWQPKLLELRNVVSERERIRLEQIGAK
jgi:hypothetical protein